MKKSRWTQFPNRDWVALILAIGIVIIVTSAGVSIVYATIINEQREVSSSSSQLLTALFGGILAILGAYVGSGYNRNKDETGDTDNENEETDEE